MQQQSTKKSLLQPYPKAIVRTPAFHLTDTLTEHLETLKEMIHDASPEFYKLIAHLSAEELMRMKDKRYATTWKFFNRAKFRAVPFGSFAAVSVVPFRATSCGEKISLNSEIQVSALRDWDDKDAPEITSHRMLCDVAYLMANATIYRVVDTYRYLYMSGGSYQLGMIEIFDELELILSFCTKKRSKPAVIEQLRTKSHFSSRKITQFLQQLLDYQLLWTDKMPNLIGTDYFFRIGQAEILPLKTTYKLAKRGHLAGSFSAGPFAGLNELVTFLNGNLPWRESVHLTDFRNAFHKRFDQQSVPLSLALDPELGIGYAGLGSSSTMDENIFLDEIFGSQDNKAPHMQVNPFLLFIITRAADRAIIHLEEYNDPKEDHSRPLPNTLSVTCRPWLNAQVIEQVGGCTATSLIGRFTICDPDIKKIGKELAEIEQKSNPDVIFFDVSHQGEQHVDNINRRQKLFEQELPLSCWSTIDAPLRADDLWIRIEGEEIIIFSAVMKKRLIPRIATAYNYNRSQLALYRFLSDLQHQGLRSNLTLNFRRLCTGLEHYPRLMYKNFVLSPQTWMVPQNLLQTICNPASDGVLQLQMWLQQHDIQDYFKCGSNDQTLVFHPEDPDDLQAFIIYCRRHRPKPIYLEEALIDPNSLVVNERKQAYAPQILLSYFHTNEVYCKPQRKVSVPDFAPNRRLLPGSDWLYLEIYCHPGRANELLLFHIRPFLKSVRSSMKQWFFIRYNKNGSHLRLRMHLNHAQQAGPVLNYFQKLLYPLMTSGLVADYQVKTYVREFERYGGNRLPLIEQYFCQDSIYVMTMLARSPGQDALYQIALNTLHILTCIAFPDIGEQIQFAEVMAKKFSIKFSMDITSFKQLNREYERLFRTQSFHLDLRSSEAKRHQLLRRIFDSCPEVKVRQLLLADLLHMHINRLLSAHQPKHEAIIYQYFFKNLKKQGKCLTQKVEY
jgi:thiopeptide-type bacteriocin biosynthesis protein